MSLYSFDYKIQADASASAEGPDEHPIQYASRLQNKAYVDKHRRPQPYIDVGTEVMVNTHVLSNAAKGVTLKFIPKRDEPYVVTQKIGVSTYETSSPSNLSIPHYSKGLIKMTT